MKGSTVGRLAACHDCAWRCEAPNAQGLASQHAERREHRVAVETLIHYDGRPEDVDHEQMAISVADVAAIPEAVPDLMAALKASLDAVKARERSTGT